MDGRGEQHTEERVLLLPEPEGNVTFGRYSCWLKDIIKTYVQQDIVAGTESRSGCGFFWAQMGRRNMREVSF